MDDLIKPKLGLDMRKRGVKTAYMKRQFMKEVPDLDVIGNDYVVRKGKSVNIFLRRCGDYNVIVNEDAVCNFFYLPDISCIDNHVNDLQIWVGKKSKLNFFAPLVLTDTDEFRMNLTCNHHGVNSEALVYILASVSDEAKLDVEGNLIVESHATGSKTSLIGKAFLLSDNARAGILPALEIKTDDVEASHKATIGQMDDAQKFYLQSRGISEKMAENMIIRGYFESLISAVNVGAQKVNITNYINNKLSLDV